MVVVKTWLSNNMITLNQTMSEPSTIVVMNTTLCNSFLRDKNLLVYSWMGEKPRINHRKRLCVFHTRLFRSIGWWPLIPNGFSTVAFFPPYKTSSRWWIHFGIQFQNHLTSNICYFFLFTTIVVEREVHLKAVNIKTTAGMKQTFLITTAILSEQDKP